MRRTLWSDYAQNICIFIDVHTPPVTIATVLSSHHLDISIRPGGSSFLLELPNKPLKKARVLVDEIEADPKAQVTPEARLR
jgi:hypothetical protein